MAIPLWGVRALSAAIAALVTAATAQASPLDLFGFGARSAAMAGVGVATADDFDAVYLNPAGLADTAAKRITLGGLYAAPALEIDGTDVGADTASGLIIGGAVPLPLGGALAGRVGLGLGFYVPQETINRARHPLPGTPIFALLEHRSHVVGLQVAAGAAIGSRWRVGLGALALAELRGTIAVTTDASGRFISSSEQQLLTRIAPIAGVRYVLDQPDIHLGLTVRGASQSEYDILVTNDLGDALPLGIPDIRVTGVAQYDPLTAALEAAWRLRPQLVLALQVAYQRWSAYPLPTENPVAGTPPQEPPGFRDIAVPRLAAEWTHSIWAWTTVWRAGYAFVLSPAPEMTGQQSLLDNHRHIVAAGLGVSRRGWPLHVGVWAQLHHLMERRHSKDPMRFPPDVEPSFATINTGGRIVAGGLTLGLDL